MEKYYTVEEIANMTRLSTRTIRRYIASGELQGVKAGRQWRFTQNDVENFFDTGQVLTDTEASEKHRLLSFFEGNREDVSSPSAHIVILASYANESHRQQIMDTILAQFDLFQKEHTTVGDIRLNLRTLAIHTLRISLEGELTALTQFLPRIQKILPED